MHHLAGGLLSLSMTPLHESAWATRALLGPDPGTAWTRGGGCVFGYQGLQSSLSLERLSCSRARPLRCTRLPAMRQLTSTPHCQPPTPHLEVEGA